MHAKAVHDSIQHAIMVTNIMPFYLCRLDATCVMQSSSSVSVMCASERTKEAAKRQQRIFVEVVLD